jgi:hypothetical protein
MKEVTFPIKYPQKIGSSTIAHNLRSETALVGHGLLTPVRRWGIWTISQGPCLAPTSPIRHSFHDYHDVEIISSRCLAGDLLAAAEMVACASAAGCQQLRRDFLTARPASCVIWALVGHFANLTFLTCCVTNHFFLFQMEDHYD